MSHFVNQNPRTGAHSSPEGDIPVALPRDVELRRVNSIGVFHAEAVLFKADGKGQHARHGHDDAPDEVDLAGELLARDDDEPGLVAQVDEDLRAVASIAAHGVGDVAGAVGVVGGLLGGLGGVHGGVGGSLGLSGQRGGVRLDLGGIAGGVPVGLLNAALDAGHSGVEVLHHNPVGLLPLGQVIGFCVMHAMSSFLLMRMWGCPGKTVTHRLCNGEKLYIIVQRQDTQLYRTRRSMRRCSIRRATADGTILPNREKSMNFPQNSPAGLAAGLFL